MPKNKLVTNAFVVTFATLAYTTNALQCQDSAKALEQLQSYYTKWYRIRHMRTISSVCKQEDPSRKQTCAEIAKACFIETEGIKVEDISQVIENPDTCSKQPFRTPVSEEKFWGSKKKMYLCKGFKIADEDVNDFFVSGAGIPGAALVFDKEEPPNPTDLKISRLVTGLSYEKASTETNTDDKNEHQSGST